MIYSFDSRNFSKFVDLCHRYIQSEVKKRNIHYNHVPSANMKSDILTKPLTKHKYTANRNVLFLLKFAELGNEGAYAMDTITTDFRIM